MNKAHKSCSVVIFEGPDGSGKTTLARAFADEMNMRYVHLGPLKNVSYRALARMYVEAMLPAIHGYQGVVMDRSWLSEPIYGKVFRGGKDRITPARARMLDRIALRCGAVVVRCDPGFNTCRQNFDSRRGAEMLNSNVELQEVWSLYRTLQMTTDLPVYTFDYTTQNAAEFIVSLAATIAGIKRAGADWQVAGNIAAPRVIVGDSYSNHNDTDLLQQFPFVDFSAQGCSLWLAQKFELSAYPIDEAGLAWINADELLRLQKLHVSPQDIFPNAIEFLALGQVASSVLHKLGLAHPTFTHPQYWKRFHGRTPYDLTEYLKDKLQ